MLHRREDVIEVGAREAGLVQEIARLGREASIEINVQDVVHLEPSRALLPAGTKVYVSHLPKQHWQQTEAACRAVRAAGFRPVPHVPVRLLAGAEAFDRLLAGFAAGGCDEVLLIAGDYAHPLGPFATVADVLVTGLLEKHRLTRVSMAGHPEGHPKVPLDEIRLAEREKVMLATQAGLDVSLVTQFFFEHAPFVEWAGNLNTRGIRALFIAGIAGPARSTTLLKFAMRCGVGPSIRALSARPSTFVHLLADHGPEHVVRGLAHARSAGVVDFAGIHLFCFGGYLRTCEWLHRVAHGEFRLNGQAGFDVGAGRVA